MPELGQVLTVIVLDYQDGVPAVLYNGKQINTTTYYTLWNVIMEKAGMYHTPHDCRHTFRSRLDSAGANKKCIDMMMGHKSKDVGERVYTHKTIKELKDAIELITE